MRVVDGYQRFREYPDGKKELQDGPLPYLNKAISPSGEWSELPQMVGTELKLEIRQAARGRGFAGGRRSLPPLGFLMSGQAGPEHHVEKYGHQRKAEDYPSKQCSAMKADGLCP